MFFFLRASSLIHMLSFVPDNWSQLYVSVPVGLYNSVTSQNFPPPVLFFPENHFYITYLSVTFKRKSTLSVPWWPAVSSLSETLLRDTALIGSRGVQKSLWLTVHGLRDTQGKKKLFFFLYFVVRLWGHQTRMVVYTVFSHLTCFSLSLSATHATEIHV